MDILEGKVNWINVVKPSDSDLKWLKKNFGLHSMIVNELSGPSARARVEANSKYLYFIYYFPIYDPVEKVSRRSEIDFIVSKKGVATVSYETVDVFDDLMLDLKPTDEIFNDPVRVVHKLVEALLAFQQRQLSHVREKVEAISGELFKEREKQREKELVENISYVKRDVSQYRIIVRPQRHILDSFFESGFSFFGEGAKIYFNDLIGEHMKVMDQLEDYRQAIDDFESTNNQLINIKNTQVVKTFTILAFVTFPMMLFSAIFSMNTKYTPIVEGTNGFWIILGVMIAAMLVMFAYFRKRDWL